MYFKLALRNAKRSLFDYLLYISSMVMLTSIIFLSNSIADWGGYAGRLSDNDFTLTDRDDHGGVGKLYQSFYHQAAGKRICHLYVARNGKR